MKNAIFKADEQLQNGFKQIYPNNNNVEINVKSWQMQGCGTLTGYSVLNGYG